MGERPAGRARALSVLVGLVVLVGLYLARRYNYLLFHGITEIFAIAVSCAVFMVAWNTRKTQDHGYFLFVGIVYLFTGGVIDVVHALSYKGMGVFPGYDANLPTQLWIGGRYLQSLSLLAAPWFAGRKLNAAAAFTGYLAVSALLFASVFSRGYFPACFIEGVGLTPFKVYSEYLIALAYLAAVAALYRKRSLFDTDIFGLLVGALAVSAASELSFTLYKADVYGLFNFTGHYLELLAYYLAYEAFIGTELTKKYDLTLRLQHQMDELKRAKEYSEHLASFPRLNPNPILEIDSSGRIVFHNPAMERLLGALGMDKEETGIFLPGDMGAILEELGSKREVTFFREIVIKGRTFGENIHLLPEFDVVRIYTFDITARRRAEEELLAANVWLEKRVAERTADLGAVATRLREELVSRRHAEENLAHKTALLQSVLESVGDAVIVADREGKFLYWNPAARRLLPQGPIDAGPEQWSERYGLFHPDMTTPFPPDRLPLLCAIRGESVDGVELFVRRGREGGEGEGEGEGLWLTCSGRPLQDAAGGVGGGVVAFSDTTAFKRGERELRRTAELLEKIFSNIHLCVVYLDMDFNFLRVNRAYAEACGHSQEFFAGKNHFDLYPDEDNEAIFRRVLATGEPFFTSAKAFEFPDHPEWGVTYWDWSLQAVRESDGKTSGLLLCLIDVTSRVRAEKARHDIETGLRTTVENMMDSFAFFTAVRDPDGRIADFRLEYINPSGCRYNDATREELVGTRIGDRFPAIRETGLIQEFCRVVETGEPLAKDGFLYKREVGEGSLRSAIDLRATKRGDGFAVFWRDVTERLRDHEELVAKNRALRETSNTLKGIIQASPLAVVLLDPRGRVKMWNQAASGIFGWTEAEVIDRFLPTVPEDKVPELLEWLTRARDGEFFTNMETQRQRKNGTLLDVLVSTAPLHDAETGFIGNIAIIADVSDRKKMERSLRASEEQFRSLVETSLVGVLILQDGRVVFLNPEQKRLFGPIPENFELKDFTDVYPEDAEKFARLCEGTFGGEHGAFEMDLRFYPYGKSPEGVDMRWVHCRSVPIEYRGKEAILVNMVDVSRAREMEQMVRNQEAMASLGHVAAGIAHEIRNPLSGINIHLSALERLHNEAAGTLGEEGTARAARIVDLIRSASGKIESVIRKVMEFSRPTVPRLEFSDINGAIVEAIDLSMTSLRKRGITLNRSHVEHLPKCHADPQLIAQVLLNLITNAAQALEHTEGPRIIEIIARASEDDLVIAVADSGPGVPPALRRKIFDPFFTTRRDGYGFGLSFCHRVISDHHGSLIVDVSNYGGAEFRIELPLGKGRTAA